MSTLAEISQMPDRMPVMEAQVTIHEAFPPRKVSGQYGENVVIDLLFADATGQMRGQWWDPTYTDHTAIKGRVVHIAARKNGKGTLAGANMRWGKDKQGNQRPELSVRGDHLSFLQPGATASQPQQPLPLAPPPPSHPVFQAPPMQAPPLLAHPAPPIGLPPTATQVTESELLAFTQRAITHLATSMRLVNVEPDAQSLAPIVNTFLIAITQQRMVIDQADVEPEPEGPDVPF